MNQNNRSSSLVNISETNKSNFDTKKIKFIYGDDEFNGQMILNSSQSINNSIYLTANKKQNKNRVKFNNNIQVYPYESSSMPKNEEKVTNSIYSPVEHQFKLPNYKQFNKTYIETNEEMVTNSIYSPIEHQFKLPNVKQFNKTYIDTNYKEIEDNQYKIKQPDNETGKESDQNGLYNTDISLSKNIKEVFDIVPLDSSLGTTQLINNSNNKLNPYDLDQISNGQ